MLRILAYVLMSVVFSCWLTAGISAIAARPFAVDRLTFDAPAPDYDIFKSDQLLLERCEAYKKRIGVPDDRPCLNIPPVLLLGHREWWWRPYDVRLYKGDWRVEDIGHIPF